MALKSTFKQADIRKMLDASARQVRTGILHSLNKLGEESVKIARDNANRNDATGRLANSIGYLIVADGQVIAQEFNRSLKSPTNTTSPTEQNATDTENEAEVGEQFARTLAAKYPKGYALIVVSGSAYAVQAESVSEDILTSAEMYVGERLKGLNQ